MGYVNRQTPNENGLFRWDDFAIIPHWNAHGRAQTGTFHDGSRYRCRAGYTDWCVELDWPDGMFPYSPAPGAYAHWHGTLLTEKRDASGLLYRRNRYYDPVTARFTQEDPIGLAGGINVNGFAAGDPVTYSDPYGLNPCRLPNFNVKECAKQATLAMLEGAVAGLGAVTDAFGIRRVGEAATGISSSDGSQLSAGQRIGGATVAALEAGATRGGFRIISRISEHAGLARHASRLSGGAQRSIDHLTGELARGNLNPGIGTRHLFGGVAEARARDGARVYFRQVGETVEILGKSTKANQSQVIETLRYLYGS